VTVIIYWFRNDLRLADNPAFVQACLKADQLLPVYVHDPKEQEKVYGFERQGTYRQTFLRASLDDLKAQLQAQGSDLLELSGKSAEVLLQLVKDTAAIAIYCEQIEAPEEIEQVRIMQEQGVDVEEFWQSSMLDPQDFPFSLEKMPDVFTAFRRDVERAKLKFARPINAPQQITSEFNIVLYSPI
jgi:deoxyribodipyrimidine photo-lyase